MSSQITERKNVLYITMTYDANALLCFLQCILFFYY